MKIYLFTKCGCQREFHVNYGVTEVSIPINVPLGPIDDLKGFPDVPNLPLNDRRVFRWDGNNAMDYPVFREI